MVARMRTNVLKREEKGIGPISFPRLLVSGFGGGLLAYLTAQFIGFIGGCFFGVIGFAAAIAATQPVHGTPLFMFLVKSIHGMVATRHMQGGGPVVGALAQAMQIEENTAALLCEEVFSLAEEQESEDEIGELVFFRDVRDLDSGGLQVVENPFEMAKGK